MRHLRNHPKFTEKATFKSGEGTVQLDCIYLPSWEEVAGEVQNSFGKLNKSDETIAAHFVYEMTCKKLRSSSATMFI